jgi:flagellar motor switch protein FliN/FliY
MLMDVALEVSVELGRSHMSIADILALRTGSVIELDKLAGEPVDVSVNGTLIARGEVVVVDEKFGVRITEVVSKARRIASLA